MVQAQRARSKIERNNRKHGAQANQNREANNFEEVYLLQRVGGKYSLAGSDIHMFRFGGLH